MTGGGGGPFWKTENSKKGRYGRSGKEGKPRASSYGRTTEEKGARPEVQIVYNSNSSSASGKTTSTQGTKSYQTAPPGKEKERGDRYMVKTSEGGAHTDRKGHGLDKLSVKKKRSPRNR